MEVHKFKADLRGLWKDSLKSHHHHQTNRHTGARNVAREGPLPGMLKVPSLMQSQANKIHQEGLIEPERVGKRRATIVAFAQCELRDK